jgi:hypothetical protein
MADTYITLQLRTPCLLSSATEWWDEVKRVVGDEETGAQVSIIDHPEGPRITVHLAEVT